MDSTKIPSGSSEFHEALERLRKAPENCTNRFDLAAECCKKCGRAGEAFCEDCFVQTIGDLSDPYRCKLEKLCVTGMYSADFYMDANGKYHYAHPQGSG